MKWLHLELIETDGKIFWASIRYDLIVAFESDGEKTSLYMSTGPFKGLVIPIHYDEFRKVMLEASEKEGNYTSRLIGRLAIKAKRI